MTTEVTQFKPWRRNDRYPWTIYSGEEMVAVVTGSEKDRDLVEAAPELLQALLVFPPVVSEETTQEIWQWWNIIAAPVIAEALGQS